jgi:hypothetical protein
MTASIQNGSYVIENDECNLKVPLKSSRPMHLPDVTARMIACAEAAEALTSRLIQQPVTNSEKRDFSCALTSGLCYSL